MATAAVIGSVIDIVMILTVLYRMGLTGSSEEDELCILLK